MMMKRIINGFTIVELIVVISIIGILAAIVIVSYNGWNQKTTTAQLKSDLNGAAAAMENARTFENKYPDTVPSTFAPSSGVDIKGGGLNNGKDYSIDATNGTVSYNIGNNYNTPQVGPRPILYLDASNAKSYPGTGTTWYDLSGLSNNASLSGATYDSVNKAISFNGSGDYAAVTSTSALNSTNNGTFSISVWLKPNTLTSAWIRGIIVQEQYLASGYRFGLGNGGQPVWWTSQSVPGAQASSAIDTMTSSQSLIINQWANVTVTYNNQQGYIYVNGAQTASKTGIYIAGANSVRVGQSVMEWYSGLISNIRYYSRALTSTEVQLDYDNLHALYGL